jgi:hypothetical protein
VTALLLVLLAPEAPLGPDAAPGVPRILWSELPEDVTIDGWPYRIRGATPVHPQRPAGGTARPVGIVGAPPRDVSGVTPLRIPLLREEHWPALDVFDSIVVMRGEPVPPVLVRWARAGGSVIVVGDASAGVPDVFESALRIARDRAPRPRDGNVRPDLYDLVRAPRGPAAPLRVARWLVLVAGAAMALPILLAGAGRLGTRPLLAGLVTVAAVGAAVGLLRGAREYRPLARGRIVEETEAKGAVRRRVYDVYLGLGPGAVVRPDPMAVPIHYRGPGDPWWSGPERDCEVPPGVTRIFRTDEVADGPAGPDTAGEPPPTSAEPGEVPLLRRSRAAPQR